MNNVDDNDGHPLITQLFYITSFRLFCPTAILASIILVWLFIFAGKNDPILDLVRLVAESASTFHEKNSQFH